MKKIILIGASGFVGSALLNEALGRGIHVTAVVRNPEKIKISSPNLKIIKADVSSSDKWAEIIRGADAVISAYSPGLANPNIYEDTLRVYPFILETVKKSGVSRFQVVGGAGSLFVSPGTRLFDSDLLPEKFVASSKSIGKFYLDTLSKETELDWVFFSPAGDLVPGERTGKYRLGKDDLIVDEKGESRISVQDYAKAMIDEFEHPSHHKERFTIGY